MFCYCNNRPTVFIAEYQGLLDCPHYRQAFEVRLEFRLEISKELADVVLPGDTNNADNPAIHLGHQGPDGVRVVLAPKVLDVTGPGETYRYLRPLFSTDSISAIAASRVAGKGAFASRHILESVSQSPPKAKLSS